MNILIIIIICVITIFTEIYLLFEGKWELDLSKSKDLFIGVCFVLHFVFTIASIITTAINFK